MGAETEFKNWWRKRFKGWSDAVEPRLSIGQGFPDVSALFKERHGHELVPIEFKIGWWKDGRLHAKFEPAQPAWHIRFKRAGGYALICVGIATAKSWDAYMVMPGDWMMQWEEGIPPENVSAWTLWE